MSSLALKMLVISADPKWRESGGKVAGKWEKSVATYPAHLALKMLLISQRLLAYALTCTKNDTHIC